MSSAILLPPLRITQSRQHGWKRGILLAQPLQLANQGQRLTSRARRAASYGVIEMGGLSIGHWLIVLAIVLLLFGTKKLRNIGGDLGSATKGFRKGLQETDEDAKPSELKADPPESPQTIGETEKDRAQH